MLLTIGMIVKNEEKFLRQCLTAIQPILKNIDSELIIVDTGSTDKTVDIAREFTDKVLFFEWVNDFAAARNVGLKEAQGEWFMFLDADEIFISCDAIIEFFKSGNYKNYNSAVYSVRNYKSLNNKYEYNDSYLPRLTKILPETAFVRPVHEGFNTFAVPIMILTDVADHYGYAFDDDPENKKKKFERNSVLLQKRLETEEKNTNPLLFSQLFDTYCFLEDKKQAIDYAYEGIELCKQQKSDFAMALYHNLITLANSEKRYEDVLKIYDEYFALGEEIRQKERTTDIEMMAYKGIAVYEMKRYTEAYDMFTEFFKAYEKHEQEGNITRESLYIAHHFKNETFRLKINMLLTECCIILGKYNEAQDNIKNCPIDKYNFTIYAHNCRVAQAMSVIKQSECKGFMSMYKAQSSKDRSELFDNIALSLFVMDEARRKEIINKLANEDLDKAVQRNRISIHKAHFIGGNAGAGRIATFIEKFGAAYADILFIMLNEELDISPFLARCEDIVQVVSDGFRSIKGFCEAVSGYDINKITDNKQLYKLIVMYLYTVIGAVENRLEITMITPQLSDLAMKYLNTHGEADLPEEVLAAVTIAEIEILRKMRNFKECVASLRKLIQINSRYAPIAKEYQNIIKADMGAIN